MSLQLHDGSKVIVNLVRPILRMAIPNMGWIVEPREGNSFYGHVINFNGKRPVYCRGQIAGSPSLEPVDIEAYGGRKPDDFYEIENYDWKDVLKRKVYNIEVEDNHTYYVGELGLWAHNKDENSRSPDGMK